MQQRSYYFVLSICSITFKYVYSLTKLYLYVLLSNNECIPETCLCMCRLKRQNWDLWRMLKGSRNQKSSCMVRKILWPLLKWSCIRHIMNQSRQGKPQLRLLRYGREGENELTIVLREALWAYIYMRHTPNPRIEEKTILLLTIIL